MSIDRRSILVSSGLLTAAATLAARDAAAGTRPEAAAKAQPTPGLAPSDTLDQTAALQSALDAATATGRPLVLPPGRFRVSGLALASGAKLHGHGRATVLQYTGVGGSLITSRDAEDVAIENISVEGASLALDAAKVTALVDIRGSQLVRLSRLSIANSLLNGITLERCSGRISDVTVQNVSQAGIFSLDAAGLEITHCEIYDCGNNGILIWRQTAGEDGTIVSQNRIERIAAKAGGTGENGNGINVFRAGSVLVSGNRIADCAYSAIRGNAASNIQMLGNSCARLGEVALYAEFGFEGAVISNNLVDGAASGIEVTNFNEGGRLAIIQGNLIRNLVRREHEPVDKRGEGIVVEADTVVSGNVVENAPTAGIVTGWGKYLRDVLVTGNLVRKSAVGIIVSGSEGAGSCLVSQNVLSGTADAAIRIMDYDRILASDDSGEPGGHAHLTFSGNLVT